MGRLRSLHWHLRYGLWIGAGVAAVLGASASQAGVDLPLLSPVAGAVYGTGAGIVFSLLSPERPSAARR